MTETTSVHGHEVIFLIHDAPASMTRGELEAEVSRRFGPDARFHTCSDGGMSLGQLLAFLIERGKVVERDGRLRVNLAEVCGGDDHHDHGHGH